MNDERTRFDAADQALGEAHWHVTEYAERADFGAPDISAELEKLAAELNGATSDLMGSLRALIESAAGD